MRNLKKFATALILLIAFTSCDSDDDGTKTPAPLNIVQTAQSVDDLSILVQAVIQADLVDALSASGSRTVLAPTNAAFTAFLQAKGFDALSDVPNEVLTQILLNHVIPDANIQSSALLGNTGYTNTMADGPNETKLSLYYDGTSNTGVTFNGVATTVAGLIDVPTSNGIVHVIDEVIDLPTVATFAVADSNFSTLETALTALTPGTDFASILSRTMNNDDNINPPFTVFAPTDAAFVALGTPPAEGVLTQVLLHHVVGGANVQSGDLTQDGDTTPTTLQGDTITITLPGTGDNIADMTDGAGNDDIGIVAVNVQAVNGVIHAINKVMLPSDDQ